MEDVRRCVKSIIENSLHTQLSISELSNIIGTNEYALKRSFKQIYGKTVHAFLIESRMTEARKMLLSEKYNVNEVANSLGYNDSTNFTAAFKKYFGYTPGKLCK